MYNKFQLRFEKKTISKLKSWPSWKEAISFNRSHIKDFNVLLPGLELISNFSKKKKQAIQE